MTNANLDSWDGFTSGTFLKATEVKSEQDAFICIATEIVNDKISEKPKIQLTLENNGKQYKYDLNAVNTRAVKAAAPNPKAVIGKKIYFKKVLVNSPKTKQEVESLRIIKVE